MDNCSNGQVCEDVPGGTPECAAPLVIRGTVKDSGGAPIANARVAVVDANDAPASGTAITDAMGAYELAVAAPRAQGGAIAPRQIKLRAAAAGFDNFPSGLRRSLPIETSTAVMSSDKMVLQSVATDIVLFAIANGGGLGSIAGTVKGTTATYGALVVAEGPQTLSTVSDTSGSYVIFNVPAGAYTVKGYTAGVQLMPASANVAGAALTGVDLIALSTPLGSVSGQVDIVNAPGGSMTSVVLVVESTFSDVLKRGDVPPGLRAPKSGPPSITGAFTIDGVPDGKYVALAAFENDGLVRDPDTSIGGTQIQHITVAGAPLPLSASFKVTAALGVVSPGAADVPDKVSGTPTFVWDDDSSEDGYTIELFDTNGVKVWENTMVPRVTGAPTVSVTYGGPALTAGGYYQFRATSIKGGVPISQTEDLRGVFQAN